MRRSKKFSWKRNVSLDQCPKDKKEATIQRTEVSVAKDASPKALVRDTLYMFRGQKAGHCAWSTFYKGKVV